MRVCARRFSPPHALGGSSMTRGLRTAPEWLRKIPLLGPAPGTLRATPFSHRCDSHLSPTLRRSALCTAGCVVSDPPLTDILRSATGALDAGRHPALSVPVPGRGRQRDAGRAQPAVSAAAVPLLARARRVQPRRSPDDPAARVGVRHTPPATGCRLASSTCRPVPTLPAWCLPSTANASTRRHPPRCVQASIYRVGTAYRAPLTTVCNRCPPPGGCTGTPTTRR